ncbi:MAG: protein kinase domain-containing protein [Gemmataceae bacterium]
MRITLTVTAGPHEGEAFPFEGHDTFLVGRSKRAHFQLPSKDRYFSRMHFLVEANPPQCRIMDLGSHNGTYVNGRRIKQADLKNGDRIRAGHTILQVAFDETAKLVPAALARQAFLSATVAASPKAPPRSGSCPSCGLDLPSSDSADSPPVCPMCEQSIREQTQFIQDYRIIRELGRGGMGVVYLAMRTADGPPVALKTIIPAGPCFGPEVERFLREASILRELDHPNIVAFRDMGESAGKLYFAMDYIRGRDAGKIVKAEGPLAVSRAVGWICQLLDGLDYAHKKGFVHRDIKPANILVAEDNGREDVKLADFGLARFYHASQLSGLTMMGEIGGTPYYMAPEQILNFREAKPAADQYAVAATLYNLLTGQHIFDLPKDMNKAFKIILENRPVPITQRRADVASKIARVIHHALAREPDMRFPDTVSLAKALRPFAREEGIRGL